jgi:hypothetical protein
LVVASGSRALIYLALAGSLRNKREVAPDGEVSCVAYLRKPFSSNLLIDAIEQIVGRNMRP